MTRGRNRLGEQHIGLPKGIKRIRFLLTVFWTPLGSSPSSQRENFTHGSLQLSHGHLQCMHAKPTPPPTLQLAPWVAPRAAVRASSGRQGTHSESRPVSMGKSETINLSCSATFRKIKDRLFVSSWPATLQDQEKTSLRIQPQEGGRSMEQLCPYKVKEYLRIYIRTDIRYFHPKGS